MQLASLAQERASSCPTGWGLIGDNKPQSGPGTHAIVNDHEMSIGATAHGWQPKGLEKNKDASDEDEDDEIVDREPYDRWTMRPKLIQGRMSRPRPY